MIIVFIGTIFAYRHGIRRSELTDETKNPLKEIVQPFIDLVHAPRALWGINLSYFNTTDEIMQAYDIRRKLKASGVGSLRYPGGEESTDYRG